MSSPYPPIDPFHSDFLKVSDLHTIYFEQVGNPKGSPILFLHGGPGGGVSPDHRQYFDPNHYHVILFDQRGAGRSTPHAELRENTTWDLVADIEKLRKHLGIEKWIVFGGSWGSTLSLVYAETHPDRVKGLILRGIFMCRKKEIDWFYQEGASKLFPEAWQKYLQPIPESERGDLVSAYYKRLTSDNRETCLEAARAWSVWEGSTSRLIPDTQMMTDFEDEEFALAFARIECHYFINRIWVDEKTDILKNVSKIKHLPCEIVHGRYDVVCPVENAFELNLAWPESKLHITPDAGHAAKEPGTLKTLIEITERFKSLK